MSELHENGVHSSVQEIEQDIRSDQRVHEMLHPSPPATDQEESQSDDDSQSPHLSRDNKAKPEELHDNAMHLSEQESDQDVQSDQRIHQIPNHPLSTRPQERIQQSGEFLAEGRNSVLSNRGGEHEYNEDEVTSFLNTVALRTSGSPQPRAEANSDQDRLQIENHRRVPVQESNPRTERVVLSVEERREHCE